MNLQIVECKGYNREEAFKDLDFKPTVFKGSNATFAWRLAGCPIPGSEDFKKWAIEQLNNKTQGIAGFGLYIITEPYNPDYRLTPCKIINNKTVGISSWHIKYWVREDELDIDKDGIINVTKVGQLLAVCDKKHEAIEFAKEYTSKTHKNCSFLRVKVPDNNFVSGYSIYSPGAAAKKGTFIAFGYNKID